MMEEKNLPLVSVLIPCYNHEKYIIDCLESIKATDYENKEIILIDDGSSDNSFSLATTWLEANKSHFVRIHYKTQSNQGICKTLNMLINLSRGEYVIPIASDDTLLENAITEPLNYAFSERKEFVITDAELINEDGCTISESALNYFGKSKKVLLNKDLLYLDILLFWEAPYQHYLAKKDFIISLGMYNENLNYEDLDLVLKATSAKQVGLLTLSTWQYRIRLGNRLTPGLVEDEMKISEIEIYNTNYTRFNGYLFLILYMFKMKSMKNNIMVLIAKLFLKMNRLFLINFHRLVKWYSNE